MEFRETQAHRPLCGTFRRRLIHEQAGTGWNLDREFHVQRRPGVAFPYRKTELERGHAFHAHLGRRAYANQSWDQYGAVAAGNQDVYRRAPQTLNQISHSDTEEM